MAITLTAAQLAEAIGSDTETATRLLSVCTELVNNFAAGAPDSVANEAVIRVSGWLKEQPPWDYVHRRGRGRSCVPWRDESLTWKWGNVPSIPVEKKEG